MRLIKYLIISLFLLSNSVFADTLDKFINSLNEQTITSEWVVNNAQTKLTSQKALSIVMDTYANSFSHELNPKLLIALIRTESGFITNAKSNHGAVGLTQVIPYWHRDKLKKRNPYLQSVSIEVGTIVLKNCFSKHKQNTFKSLNCYSGGGGKKYHNKINKFQKDLTAYILKSNKEIIASNP